MNHSTEINTSKESKLQIILTIVLTSSLLFLISSDVHAATVPGSPTNLSAVAISPSSVRLLWSPPQNGGSGITNYMIEYKTATGSYGSPVTAGNVTTYDITSLTQNQQYIFRVSANNSTGTSPPSQEQTATPRSNSAPPNNLPPGPPIGLTAISYSGTQINLAWNPPASNGGYPVSGYMIQYSVDSGSFTTLVSNTGTATTGYSHTGLLTGHTYTYNVYAINLSGTGGPSNTASAIPTQVSTAPNPPTGLVASAASLTSISLTWVAPQNTGGSAITGYKIEYKIGTGTYSVLVANTASTATSYLHTGLTTGTTYTYRISAINSIGTGSPSNEVSAAATKTYTPTGVTAVAVSPTQVNLSWIPPSETYQQTIVGYKINQKLSSGIFNTIVDNTGQTTSYSITNLSTGKTYTFVVIAIYNGGVDSNPSPEASATPTSTTVPPPTSTPPPTSNPPPQTSSLPGTPTGLTATKVSSSSVQLLWAAPLNNGKPPIAGYRIEIKIGTGDWSVLLANAGNITSYTHTGLAGSTFTYRVSAINSAGTGNPSNEATVTLTNINPNPPPVMESSGGTLAVTNTAYSVNYAVIGGKVFGISADKDTFSLQIKLESQNNGVLSLNLPRELIDAKKADGTDDFFIVTAGKDLLKFNETKNSIARALTIGYPAGTNEIFIYGTHVVPEFPISILVLVIALIPVLLFSKRIK